MAVVVGLDFGTTFSGYAFARESVPDDIRVEETWPGQQQAAGRIYQKTKTCILFQDGSLKDWGWEAELAGLELSHREFHASQVQLLERFKLCLADDKQDGAPNLPKGVTAEGVIQHFLKGLSTFAKQRLAVTFGKTRDQDIRWWAEAWHQSLKTGLTACAV